jgi:hypothetical protein
MWEGKGKEKDTLTETGKLGKGKKRPAWDAQRLGFIKK